MLLRVNGVNFLTFTGSNRFITKMKIKTLIFAKKNKFT